MPPVDRPTLNREIIARAALEIIDVDGMPGLSMRKLGSKLGVEAMSLYHYVANKDDLLHAALEQIYLEIQIPEITKQSEWESAVRGGLVSFRDTLARHPNAMSLFAQQPAISPGAFGVFYSAYQRLRMAGLAPTHAHEGLNLIVSFVLGHLMLSITSETDETVFDLVVVTDEMEDDVRTFIEAGAAVDADRAFDAALDTMLSGLRSRFDLP